MRELFKENVFFSKDPMSRMTLIDATLPKAVQADAVLRNLRREKREATADEQALIDEVEAAREIIIQVREGAGGIGSGCTLFEGILRAVGVWGVGRDLCLMPFFLEEKGGWLRPLCLIMVVREENWGWCLTVLVEHEFSLCEWDWYLRVRVGRDKLVVRCCSRKSLREHAVLFASAVIAVSLLSCQRRFLNRWTASRDWARRCKTAATLARRTAPLWTTSTASRTAEPRA